MKTTRLETFSDGVIAILITIMVLQLKTPKSANWIDIKPLIPVLLSYIISFIMLAIYWGNHHHLLHAVDYVNSRMLWANIHLLFWLSLIPFASAWMGESNFENVIVAFYAIVLDFCAITYFLLLRLIMKSHSEDSDLLKPLKKQAKKGRWSVLLYTSAIAAAFIHPLISGALYLAVALLWWMPDKNIEKTLKEQQ